MPVTEIGGSLLCRGRETVWRLQQPLPLQLQSRLLVYCQEVTEKGQGRRSLSEGEFIAVGKLGKEGSDGQIGMKVEAISAMEASRRLKAVDAEALERELEGEATRKKEAAEDISVTFEDQQKLNKLARNTSRITELKEEIEVKKKQLQNLEDACDAIMLADDDCITIPYQIGDVFISHSQEENQHMLVDAKKNLQEEIDTLVSRVAAMQRDLKVQLYVKFGSNINLEADES
ncbi:PREDICTED: prefoldin subunit 4-like [Dipodomys ordii]|uniref:Prefoldin subunit 4-like n=1 Tax=Dipodomys ordii TaxID=10020 RepID=A0A1S3GQM6_DIPOR|nr:PREDICTED: prefoldin subunit 4-like [Dipodomys ordii]